jgi:hypothetical protein
MQTWQGRESEKSAIHPLISLFSMPTTTKHQQASKTSIPITLHM